MSGGDTGEGGGGALLTEAVAAVAVLIVGVGLWKTGHLWLLALAVLGVLVLAFARWAFLPRQRVPKHRTRHLRIRLRLRLHPGRGHATAFELWWRWSARAIRRSARRTRLHGVTWSVASTFSVLVGFAHYRLRIRIPLDEHAVVLAPPRTGKSGWLAGVIMHYPGPVVSTTTKADVFSLTSGIRERRRSGPRVQSAAHRRRCFHLPVESAGGVPGTCDRHPACRCVRAGRQPEGRGGRRLVRPEGRGVPARPVLRGRAGGLRHAHGRGLGAWGQCHRGAGHPLGARPEAVGTGARPAGAGRRARPPRPSR